MKKLLTLSILLLVALAMTAFAGEKMDVESTSGEITSVNASEATFTVRSAEDGSEQMTFHIDDRTKIIRDGRESNLNDLAAGDKVTVNYKQDDKGRFLALSVGTA